MEELLLSRKLCFKSADSSNPIHAPISLNPTPFSSAAFHRASELQPAFNLLVLRTIQSPALLTSIARSLAQSDPFIHRLYEIYQQYPRIPRLFFNVNRSDYMVAGERIFQIELNTISASLAGLSTKLSQLQRERFPALSIPENRACSSIAESFDDAVNLYEQEYNTMDCVVLFIVQEDERNIYDQQHLINSIKTHCVIKKSLKDPSEFSIDPLTKKLTCDEQEIGLIYYRAGYSPEEYKSPLHWQSRSLLESSRAIKCPDIAAHLAGLKKVQQVLTDPQTLLQTMQNDLVITNQLISSFAGIYSLDGTEEGDRNCAMALANPDKFVLKPQREGGGNNYYGPNVRSHLQALTPQDRAAYILMDRIRPTISKNTIFRANQTSEINAVSELGIYGVILAKITEDEEILLLNKATGYLLRTKPEESDEGGVVSGYSVLDVPQLI